MTTLAQMPPLQVACTDPKCRRRQNVPLTDVYAVQVRNRSGGSHKDAGCVCRICGGEIAIPASFLRKGVLPLLRSKAELESSRAPAVVDDRNSGSGLPAWTLGESAADMLDTAIARIATEGGDMVGLALQGGIQQTVDMPYGREEILATLDRNGCHLLVACGPNADGSTWQMVMHPASGAATLASAA